jgi:hypothetical protein
MRGLIDPALTLGGRCFPGICSCLDEFPISSRERREHIYYAYIHINPIINICGECPIANPYFQRGCPISPSGRAAGASVDTTGGNTCTTGFAKILGTTGATESQKKRLRPKKNWTWSSWVWHFFEMTNGLTFVTKWFIRVSRILKKKYGPIGRIEKTKTRVSLSDEYRQYGSKWWKRGFIST